VYTYNITMDCLVSRPNRVSTFILLSQLVFKRWLPANSLRAGLTCKMSPPRISRIKKKPSCFPFHRLPTELATEIISNASTPDFADSSLNPYSNPLTLCLVSHAVRQAAIPQLLDRVILSEGRHVYAFTRAILMQRTYRQNQSRLAVDYSTHVRRMWCGTCWEVLVDEPRDSPSWLDYGALWEVMRNVESLGIKSQSMHLLYNGLATEVDAMDVDEADGKAIPSTTPWKCRRVTFAGDYCRWRPLTSTAEGSAFLASITHLVLWMPDHNYERQSASTTNSEVTPRWMEHVPFEMMRSLTDIGFVLSRFTRPVASNSIMVPSQMLAYHLPKHGTTSIDETSLPSEHDPTYFRRWAVDDMDPVSHGLVLPLYVGTTVDGTGVSWVLDWEKAWVAGQSEYSWEAAQKRAELAQKATCQVVASHW